MGELLVDYFERLSQIDPFDLEHEYVVAFQDGEEAADDGHYVVREHEFETGQDEAHPKT